jgi:hypothetical protein
MLTRFYALGALITLAGVAQANDPNCYLRTMGSTISTLGATVVTDVQDSNIDPVSMSLVYDNETTAAVGVQSAYTSVFGAAQFGQMSLSSTAVIAGPGSAKATTAPPSGPDEGFNVKFKDQIEFWTPSITFGQLVSYRISVKMSSALAGFDGFGQNGAQGSVMLSGFSGLSVYNIEGLGEVGMDSAVVEIANGDSLSLMGMLGHNLDVTSQGTHTIYSTMGVTIEALTPGAKYMSCSGYNYAPVPEPASMAALGLGLAAIARRRRNK